MAVNISAAFSKEDRPRNGLERIAAKLVDDDLLEAEYWVVGKIRPNFYKVSSEDGSRTPTIKFGGIEVAVEPADEKVVREIYQRLHQDRTGIDDTPPADLFSVLPDGERQVPEASAEEILAEHEERKAARAAEVPAAEFSGSD